jgi:hypothetical protein
MFNGGRNMSYVLLDNVAFKLDNDVLLKKLHIQKGSEDAQILNGYIEKAQAIGRPKAVYKQAFIESRGDDFVTIDGIKFTSRVLSINLKDVFKAFPYILTCGTELGSWAKSVDDMLENYWVNAICEIALDCARKALNADIQERFKVAHSSSMNPGSLEDWPISEQKKLFSLLGDTKGLVGVELTDSFLMVPIKSVSGIVFPSEATFESCQLCHRQNCPGRRAPYDSSLYESKYR